MAKNLLMPSAKEDPWGEGVGCDSTETEGCVVGEKGEVGSSDPSVRTHAW